MGAAPRDIAARDIAASARAALAKVRIRLLPFLCLLYPANYLDRINVSFASLQMNHDLGFTPVMFGLGAGGTDGEQLLVRAKWIIASQSSCPDFSFARQG